MRLILALLLAGAGSQGATAAEAERGGEIFAQACAACHSLAPDRNMTGPSLAGIWGRKAGSLPSFRRYSPALKAADLTWTDETLDAWLKDPQAFIPGNAMRFPGLADEEARADLIAALKAGEEAFAQGGADGMAGMTAEAPSLRALPPEASVRGIEYCGDTYRVTTADGKTAAFWERNLRFKTDSSAEGPQKNAPALLGAGMMGDRASVVFASPEEFAAFIERTC